MRGHGLTAVLLLLIGLVSGRAFNDDASKSRWQEYVTRHASRPFERMLQVAPTAAPSLTSASDVFGNLNSGFGSISPSGSSLTTSSSPNDLFSGTRRRLGEGDEDEEEEPAAAAATGAAALPAGPFCFPIAANEDKSQALLTDCVVSEEGSQDAGSCCAHCQTVNNCTGYSYISGGSLPKPRCCLAIRTQYPRLLWQGVRIEPDAHFDQDAFGLAASLEEISQRTRANGDNSVYAEADVGEMEVSFLSRKPTTWGEWAQRLSEKGLRLVGLLKEPETPMELLAYQNPKVLKEAFGLVRGAQLDIVDSGAPGLMYVSPDSGFSIITGMSKIDAYNLNWYGCPYDKEFDREKCSTRAPPTCRCLDDDCTGYCAGPTKTNLILPNIDYYAPHRY